MARLLLLLTLVVALFDAPPANQQSDAPLTQSQLEELLKREQNDRIVAMIIRTRGISSKVDSATLDRLIQRAGQETQQVLRQWEARAAYAEFSSEKDPANQLIKG